MRLPKFYKPHHFEAHEFVPPEVFDRWGERSMYLFMDVRVLITADQIRDFFSAPVKANNWWWKRGRGLPEVEWLRYRGYRPDTYYTGDPLNGSQHRFGRALDCDIYGVQASEARDIIVNHQSTFPFIKRIEDAVNWLHFDVANLFYRGIHLFHP